MMTLLKMATIEADLGSASQTLMLRRARPLIVAALSNEAINGSVTFGLILLLQRFDDLVDPGVGFQKRSCQVLGEDSLILRVER